MARVLHSITVPEQAISADGTQQFDLAVNPLSVVLLGIRPLNDTGTLASHVEYLNMCRALNRVTILFRGESIVSMRGEDIAALNWLRHGIVPETAGDDNVDNERRCEILPVLMGKNAYDPHSCFPASHRGELILEVDFDIADTGYDGLRFSADTIELLDARPSEYEKKLQVTQTFAATGQNDVDLVAANLNRGVLLFGTTPFGGAAPAPSWGRIRCLLDNQEQAYSGIDWEVLKSLHSLWGRHRSMLHHKHTVNAAGAGIEESTSVFDHADDTDTMSQWAYLDFDPTRDDMFSLDTRGKTRFQLRAEAETADAIRAVQVEVIRPSSLTRAGAGGDA